MKHPFQVRLQVRKKDGKYNGLREMKWRNDLWEKGEVQRNGDFIGIELDEWGIMAHSSQLTRSMGRGDHDEEDSF